MPRRIRVVKAYCVALVLGVAFLGLGTIPVRAEKPSSVGVSHLPEEKLGSKVLFPGIGQPVLVSHLKYAAGIIPSEKYTPLPEAHLKAFIQARDRNAKWLICERRRDYEYISYVLKLSSSGHEGYQFPVQGRYDRGIFLLLPSEYVLYYGNVSAYRFDADDEYFKIIVDPSSADVPTGIPNYVNWATAAGFAPLAWQNPHRLELLLQRLDGVPYSYGYELWFDRRDLRLVKELVLVPRVSITDDGKLAVDTEVTDVIKEVTYTYEGGSEYPTRLSLITGRGKHGMELIFQYVDGFWMLKEGTSIRNLEDPDEKFNWYLQVSDVHVEK